MKTSPLGGDNPRIHWGECTPAGGPFSFFFSLIAFFWASLSDEGGPMPYSPQKYFFLRVWKLILFFKMSLILSVGDNRGAIHSDSGDARH